MITRPSVCLPTGTHDRLAGVDGLHAAHHAVGRLHGDAAHPAFAEMLLDLHDHVDGLRDVKAFAGERIAV